MKLAMGADHGGYSLKEVVKKHLVEAGHEVLDLGTHDTESCNYPVYAEKVAYAVADKDADLGVLICGTGIVMSMCANKHRGIRAALCSDTYSARLTRNHNDANVICMGARVIGSCLAVDILDSFLGAEFEGGRHAVRVDMMMAIEEK